MKILKAFVVEDSPVIRDSLIAALEDMLPLRVVGTAQDEEAALRWLADPANDCDIAIVDVFLRQGSGVRLLDALQARQAGFDRVVLTNYASEAIRQRCLQLGASRVFDKSGEIDALVDYCSGLSRAGGD